MPASQGFNKPFKDRIRWFWTDWMIEEGLSAVTTTAPTRQRVAEWIDKILMEMASASTNVKNAWMKWAMSGSIACNN